MRRLEFGRIGVTMEVRETFRDDAVELEKLGYSTIWLPGGQLTTLDPLADVVGATQTVNVGSAIIAAERYSAETVAATYADIEARNPGRFVVGLGGAHGSNHLKRLNAYLDDLDVRSPAVPVSARVLAAMGPRKLELARERAGGALPQLVTPEYTAWARSVLGSEPALVIPMYVVLDREPGFAREAARRPVEFLTKVDGYVPNIRRMGFTERDAEEISDRLVDGLVAWGDVDAVAARVLEHLDAGADQVVLTVLPTPSNPDPSAAWSALADRLNR